MCLQEKRRNRERKAPKKMSNGGRCLIRRKIRRISTYFISNDGVNARNAMMWKYYRLSLLEISDILNSGRTCIDKAVRTDKTLNINGKSLPV